MLAGCFGDIFPFATENYPNRVMWQNADFLTSTFPCKEQVVISFQLCPKTMELVAKECSVFPPTAHAHL